MEKQEESPSLIKYGKSDKVQVRKPCVKPFQKNLVHPKDLRRRRGTECKLQVPGHQETGREKFFNPVLRARKIHARHRATENNSQVHQETCRIVLQICLNL